MYQLLSLGVEEGLLKKVHQHIIEEKYEGDFVEIIKSIITMSEKEFKEIKAKEHIKGFAEGVLTGMILIALLIRYWLGIPFF